MSYAAKSREEACANFPVFGIGAILNRWVFPYGNHFRQPSDRLASQVAESMMVPGPHRERLTGLCYVGAQAEDAVGIVEQAFYALHAIRPLERKLKQAEKSGIVTARESLEFRLKQATEAGLLTAKEVEAVRDAERLRYRAIQVDHFSNDFSEVLTFSD
jgi:hypothetical protein